MANNYIEQVTIFNFWGDRTVCIDFNNSINFIIGVNGSGKTTVINLIAAALAADLSTLERLSFSKIVLKLKEVQGRKKPYIEITKSPNSDSEYSSIEYQIRGKQSENPKQYVFDSPLDERYFRFRFSKGYSKSGLERQDIVNHLSELVNICWLSIHRLVTPYNFKGEKSFESSVDLKIGNLSTNLTKYFTALDKQASIETDTFQQTIFLSLVADETKEETISFLKKLDFEKERNSLIDIFKMFRMSETKFVDKVDKHFDEFSKAIKQIENKKHITWHEFASVVATKRINSIVKEWNLLKLKQKDIYKHRDAFIEIINSMLQRKRININNKNELEVETQSNKLFPLSFLSSGEKQLLIILGEALLQRLTPCVYIADEPELSLHVTWQEKLVLNIKKINPNAQIIFATHSPDIISSYEEHIIDMEKILK